jgi:hypothetical protein
MGTQATNPPAKANVRIMARTALLNVTLLFVVM